VTESAARALQAVTKRGVMERGGTLVKSTRGAHTTRQALIN
jgi:hypothetical protein